MSTLREQVDAAKEAILIERHNHAGDTPREIARRIRAKGWDPAITSIALRALRRSGKITGY